MATRAIAGPLGEMFGRDPAQFFQNIVKQNLAHFRALTKRCSDRTGVTSWSVSQDGKAYRSTMVATTNHNALQTALIVCLWCLKNPGTLIDEAARLATNAPVGPRIRSFDEDANLANDGWAQNWKGGQLVRSFDPATITLILMVGVPILVAIAPIVLPILIDFVGGLFGGKTPAASGETPGDAPPPSPAGLADKAEEFLTGGEKVVGVPVGLLVVGAAALLAFALLYKPKG